MFYKFYFNYKLKYAVIPSICFFIWNGQMDNLQSHQAIKSLLPKEQGSAEMSKGWGSVPLRRFLPCSMGVVRPWPDKQHNISPLVDTAFWGEYWSCIHSQLKITDSKSQIWKGLKNHLIYPLIQQKPKSKKSLAHGYNC